MDYDLFMQQITTTARAEMEAAGYEQLRTPEDVEEAFARKGTTLVMVNSVCGWAGGIANKMVYSDMSGKVLIAETVRSGITGIRMFDPLVDEWDAGVWRIGKDGSLTYETDIKQKAKTMIVQSKGIRHVWDC